MIIGSFSFTVSNTGKVSGVYRIDTRNKMPIYRFDVSKYNLKGAYYIVTSKRGRRFTTGNVAIQRKQNDVY